MKSFFKHSAFSIFKNRLPTLLAFSLLIIFFAGCTKENDTSITPDENVTVRETALNALELLSATESDENEQVNKALYLFAHAVKEASLNQTLLDKIRETVKSDQNGFGTSIAKLAASNQGFADAIGTTLKSELRQNNILAIEERFLQGENKDLINVLASKMICRGKTYEPVIYNLAKPEISASDQAVIIAIGEEVTDKDEVLAYRNNEETTFLLSEETTLASKDEIYFVGVGDIPEKEVSPIIIDPNLKSDNSDYVTIRADVDVDADRYQIKAGYRYDDSNQSEVYCWVLKYYQGQQFPALLSQWQDFDPRNINASDINSSVIFTGDKDAFGFNPTDFSTGISAFVGGWENDWYASSKLVGNPCSPFGDHSVAVKMKFSDQWYFYDCGVANTWWPSVNSNKLFENQKCMFDMKRKI